MRKCKNCGCKRFFVDTFGFEHCTKCYAHTGHKTEATGKLSYRQIDLEKQLKKRRSSKTAIKSTVNKKRKKDIWHCQSCGYEEYKAKRRYWICRECLEKLKEI